MTAKKAANFAKVSPSVPKNVCGVRKANRPRSPVFVPLGSPPRASAKTGRRTRARIMARSWTMSQAEYESCPNRPADPLGQGEPKHRYQSDLTESAGKGNRFDRE